MEAMLKIHDIHVSRSGIQKGRGSWNRIEHILACTCMACTCMKIFVHCKFCSGKDGFALQFASSSMKVPICAEMPVVFVCKEGLMGICVVMQSHSAVSKSHTCPRCTLKHFVTKCYRTTHCHIISYYLISLPWLSLLEPLRRPTVKWLQLLRSTYEKLL